MKRDQAAARPAAAPAVSAAAIAASLSSIAIVALLPLAATPAHAAVPLPAAPSWSSLDTDYATGAALADLDGDGDLDLVTSNGNDMEMQKNAVYYNVNGDSLERRASWRSSDLGYHGQLAVGDVDGDGDPDVAVARYGDPAAPQQDRLYRNVGGILEAAPSWVSGDLDNTFSIAFGDVDGDGDLDLAAGCGESYSLNPQRVKLYLNTGGTLATTASWQGTVTGYAYDVAWGDVDGDGDLDLAVANERGPNHVYRNLGAMLESSPSWVSGDDNHSAQLDWGDVDKDGDLDLAVADNNQIGDRPSRVRIYRNHGGTLDALPYWTSGVARSYYSCVRWGDADFDGDLDLAAGGWWEPVEVYENHAGTLETVASWSWHPAVSSNLVCEQLAWGDVDRRSLFTFLRTFDGNGTRKLFYLGVQPVQSIVEVKVGGVALLPSQYCFDLEAGWLSLATPPPAGTATLGVRYVASASLDLVVTNWVKNSPNHLFKSALATPTGVAVLAGGDAVAAGGSAPVLALSASPNPARSGSELRFTLTSTGEATVGLYGVDGREVRAIASGTFEQGEHRLRWDGTDGAGRAVPAGIYFVKVCAGGTVATAKVLVVR